MKVNGYKLSLEETHKEEPTIYAFIDEDFFKVVPSPLRDYYDMNKIFKSAKTNEKMVEIRFAIRPCDSVLTSVEYREYRFSEEEIRLMGGLKKTLMLVSDTIDKEAKTLFRCPLIYWDSIRIRRQFVKHLMKTGEIKCYGTKEK